MAAPEYIEVSGKLDKLISQVKRGLNAELTYYTNELGVPAPPEPFVNDPVFEEYDEERIMEELETGDIVQLVEQRQQAAGKLLTQLDETMKQTKAKLVQLLQEMKNDNTNQELGRLDYWLQFVENSNRKQDTNNNSHESPNRTQLPHSNGGLQLHLSNNNNINKNNNNNNYSAFSSVRSPIDTTTATPDSPASPLHSSAPNPNSLTSSYNTQSFRLTDPNVNANINLDNNNSNSAYWNENADNRYNSDNYNSTSAFTEDDVAVDSPFRVARRSISAPPNANSSPFMTHKRAVSPGLTRPKQQLSSSKGYQSPSTSRRSLSQSQQQKHQYANTQGRDYFPEKEGWLSTDQYFKQAHRSSKVLRPRDNPLQTSEL